MSSERVLILGAASAIAERTARLFAAAGAHFFLVARDPAKLEALRLDLAARGAGAVHVRAQDLAEIRAHGELLDQARAALGEIDIALLAYGVFSDQQRAERDFDEVLRVLHVNFISAASLLEVLARYFEQRGQGCIAAISSVAGDRGRQSHYIYGASKAGLDAYLQGLRNRLYLRHKRIHVLTIKPGLVATPMTRDRPKNFLFASPERVASDIETAIRRRQEVLYTPWFWRPIMATLRAIPEGLFKRLRL